MTNFAYTSGNPGNLTSGASASMTDIQGPFTDVTSFFNSRTCNEDNPPVSLLQRLGLNDSSGQKARGTTQIATQEARTNTAYGLLATPDRVSGIVLPTNGLIAVAYQAMWFESVSNAARAAIFVGANQLKIASVAGAPVVTEAQTGGAVGTSTPLHTHGGGIISENASSAITEVTTGQVVGGGAGVTQNGICYIFAAAGTYDISVQFKASSGTVTALNRHLWVWSVGF